MSVERHVWAEVNLSAIRNNMLRLKSLLKPGVRFCAVVKADGYGHGSVPVAAEAVSIGADYLAVAAFQEAEVLRDAGFTHPILVFGHVPYEVAPLLVSKRVTQTVYTMEQGRVLSQAAVGLDMKVKVHAKIDTGMSRLGIRPEDAAEFCAALAALPNIELEGVFTHFATADNEDKTLANAQFAAFMQALEAIKAKGLNIAIRHCTNSAATMDMPEAHLDMVRPGIVLYGVLPDPASQPTIDVRPALTLVSRVVYFKVVRSGNTVGYGASWRAPHDTRVATFWSSWMPTVNMIPEIFPVCWRKSTRATKWRWAHDRPIPTPL